MHLLDYSVASHRLETKLEDGINLIEHQSKKKMSFCRNSLEDEFHFVIDCKLYQDLRQECIKMYIWARPNIPKFIELLQSENKKTIKNLSLYIFKSFKKRNEFLS